MNIPHKIEGFELYTKTPNMIKFGYLYTIDVEMKTNNCFKQRTIRVWLPEKYEFNNPKKRYPVIYMSDGQNLVDKYTSPYGEWEIDDHIHNMMNDKFKGIIVVGIDCPKSDEDRFNELCPPFMPDKNKGFSNQEQPYGDIYGNFVFEVIKPLIDKIFFTLPERKYTGVGGSSMGGIMSFYLGCKYYEKVGFSLCFSPAFFLYKNKTLINSFKTLSLNSEKYGKFFFYVGGEGFEKKFVKSTFLIYELMMKKGFDKDRIALISDSRQIHHETAWSKYFEEGLKFLISDFIDIEN